MTKKRKKEKEWGIMTPECNIVDNLTQYWANSAAKEKVCIA